MTTRTGALPPILLLLLPVACRPAETSGIIGSEAPEELTIIRRVTLGEDDGPGMLADPWGVESRGNGEWIVPDYYLPQKLRFFSADGTWVRAMGREGEGPGEFSLPGRVWTLEGDSFAVIDHMLRRITWYSPDLQVTRISGVPNNRAGDKVLAQGADMVVSDPSSTAGLIRYWSASDGKWTTIEPYPEAPDLGDEWTRRRLLPIRVHGPFWAAHLTRYRLERWSPDGDLLQRIDREVDWFPPQYDYHTQRPKAEGPPSPSIQAVQEDASGRVWVAIHVPDPNWEEAYGPGRGPFSGQERVTDWNAYYDTLIEVIDPARNRVLASGRLDRRILAFTSAGDFWAVGASPTGNPIVEVYAAALPK